MSVEAGRLEDALGGECDAAVLRESATGAVEADQVLHEVRARRVRGPAQRLLQDADATQRAVLHRRLQTRRKKKTKTFI